MSTQNLERTEAYMKCKEALIRFGIDAENAKMTPSEIQQNGLLVLIWEKLSEIEHKI